MKHFTNEALSAADRFFRANLVNCLTGIKPALLIGTMDERGRNNLALFSSVFHLGADPALIGFVQRPLTDFSHTYRNIIASGSFTINHVPGKMVAAAHHTSAKFNDSESEFDKCGFTPAFTDGFPAPYVAESGIRIGLRFVREIAIPENGTRLMIGEVREVWIDEELLLPDGNLRLEDGVSVGVGGLESYYSLQAVGRFSYAKPDRVPVNLL
ncbi:MAG: hypothetical protein RL021_289 [Bacteroidota bacterium]